MGIIVFLFFIAVIILCISVLVAQSKKAKEKKMLMANRNAISYLPTLHIDGLGIQENSLCDIIQFNDRIQIESGNHKFQIPLGNIRAAVVKTESELVEKGKSVVGRAIIGTLLVPGLGTIVGGMSGVGSKKKKGSPKNFLILNYLNSRGEMDAATFLDTSVTIKAYKFCKSINDAVNVTIDGEVIQL